MWGNPVKKMPKKPKKSLLDGLPSTGLVQEEEEALRWLKSQTFQQPPAVTRPRKSPRFRSTQFLDFLPKAQRVQRQKAVEEAETKLPTAVAEAEKKLQEAEEELKNAEIEEAKKESLYITRREKTSKATKASHDLELARNDYVELICNIIVGMLNKIKLKLDTEEKNAKEEADIAKVKEAKAEVDRAKANI